MVWLRLLPGLLKALRHRLFLSFEIETAGVFDARDFGDDVVYNLSPKLPSAEAEIEPDPRVLATYERHRHTLKFVIKGEDDWIAMQELLNKLPPAMKRRAWVMPEGTTREGHGKRLAWLLERAFGSGLKVTSRMHVAAFGEERGR